jgi:AGZA family xanthine/uracil permease-like MFS transporter
LTNSGGTYVCNDDTGPRCATDLDYNLCLGLIRREFITIAAAISTLTSFIRVFFTKMLITLARSMGLNAYFTYIVVGFHGLSPASYKVALTAV